MRQDLLAAKQRDPAAGNAWEVALTYPGVHAVWAYRISHSLWNRGLRLPARLLQGSTRMLTGVDIHPGATLGERLFIDHAMGVVIGETAEVGDDVLIFHEVTLGGVTMTHGKRHPTVGDRVILGAGSKILGPVTIGSDAKVGANAVVVKDVPAYGIAVGVPSHLTGEDGSRGSQRLGVLAKPNELSGGEEPIEQVGDSSSSAGKENKKLEGVNVDVEKVCVGFRATYVHDDGVMVEPALYI